MSILAEIVRAKRTRLRTLQRERSWASLEAEKLYGEARRSLSDALLRETEDEPIRFLTEIKRASPSAGWIRPGADALEIGEEYKASGSSGISLLTEEEFFQGRLEDLPRMRTLGLPVLMKDFFVDPYQVALCRALGGDALLLIAALGDVPLLEEVRAAAAELEIEVLVEVHDEAECEIAHRLETELVGVNNRNLRSFEVSLDTSERLLDWLPPDPVRLSESGIRTRQDAVRLERIGFDALLVGESLMRAPNPGRALRELRGEADRDPEARS